MSDNPHVYGDGESYRGVVPAKHPNKGGRLPAEGVGERPLTKSKALGSKVNPEVSAFRTAFDCDI